MAERTHAIASPVTAAFATSFRLSSRALYGNVASALAGASAMLAGSCPARAEAAHRLTTQILALEPLRVPGSSAGQVPADRGCSSCGTAAACRTGCRARGPAATAC